MTIFYINSNNRKTGHSSDFTYELQGIPADADSVVVLQASIPMTYYIVATGYNTFQLVENGIYTIITIPIGNYNANTFLSKVLSLITAASPHLWTYTGVFSELTGLYTFTVANISLMQPVFVFNNTLNQQFGMLPNSHNQFTGNKLTSSQVLNFIPESTIFIHSDIITGHSNVLQEIYSSNTSPFSIATWICPSVEHYSKKLSLSSSGIFHFSLTDEDNIVLNTNGGNILITLKIYKKDNLTDIMKQFVKYTVLKDNSQDNNNIVNQDKINK